MEKTTRADGEPAGDFDYYVMALSSTPSWCAIEGDAKKIKRQKDSWTFARTMGSDDPNWKLIATGE